MILLIIACLIIIIVEETFHRFYGNQRQGYVCILDSEDQSVSERLNRFRKQNQGLVFVLLLFLVFLWVSIGVLNRSSIPGCAQSQIAGILVLLQVLRLFGNRLIDRWIIWTSLSGLQFFLLFSLLLLGKPEITSDMNESLMFFTWLGSMSIIFTGGIFSAVFCFVLAYFLRLFTSSHCHIYEEYPPLAVSEEWIRKGISVVIPFILISSGANLVILIENRISLLHSIPVILVAVLLILSSFQSRHSGKPHNPVSNAVTAVSYIIFLILVFLEKTGFFC